MPFKFEKLKIWQIALELAGEISDMVKAFPKDELFILTFQIKRASDSVVLNITEGSTLQSDKEFSRFLVMANRSAMEVIGCLYLAKQRKYIDQTVFTEKYTKYENLIIKIQSLINSLNK
ncbi:four helix bundle protein [Panacibacter ginsenosidivorans]|uniref:Four helix bundle protein n=1 Tax=Panacibacter ginsenosidivorans TaxID=1813871 RepID=A0A5B8V8E6_9BACT|nr:four helix bundle protein [Panacibacter ginsenosidivorans]QEC67435.1 four helix bundle protein [Panacibacter ginsenosidivorans]